MSIFPEIGTPENKASLEPGRGGGRVKSGGARAWTVRDRPQQGRARCPPCCVVDFGGTIGKHNDTVRRNPVLTVVELNSLQASALFYMENCKNMALYNPKVRIFVSLPANPTDVCHFRWPRVTKCLFSWRYAVYFDNKALCTDLISSSNPNMTSLVVRLQLRPFAPNERTG